MKVVFLNSHPISYFSDLYSFLEKNKLNIEVWYCSRYGIKKHFDKEFGAYRNVEGLLKGFRFKFLKNLLNDDTIDEKFFDTLNPSIFRELKSLNKGDLIICHGWSRLTMIIVFLFAKFYGLKVGLRAETPIIHEPMFKGLKKYLRKCFLKFLFYHIDYFFYIGTYNKKFYNYMGVPNSKLIFLPYSVKPININHTHTKKYIRRNNVLFCGKLIDKKNPLDLLDAFSKIKNRASKLIFAGTGNLENKLKKKVNDLKLNDRILFKGLLSKKQLNDLYQNIDVIVLPSGYGETWGLVINEAIEYGVPVIISDLVGCSIDLCVNNGFVYKYGSIADLKQKLEQILNMTDAEYLKLREESMLIKNEFSFQTIKHNLISFIKNRMLEVKR